MKILLKILLNVLFSRNNLSLFRDGQWRFRYEKQYALIGDIPLLGLIIFVMIFSSTAYGVECQKVRNPEYIFYYPWAKCPPGSTEILYT